MTDPPINAGSLLRRLHDADIEYVVIGGFAVIAHGVQRFTKDLDICPSPDTANLARLAAMLKDAEGGNFRLLTADGVLDLMQWIPGIAGDHAYPILAPDAVEGIVFGIPLMVCSLTHLREMKRAADRPQDRQDLADLAAAHPDQN